MTNSNNGCGSIFAGTSRLVAPPASGLTSCKAPFSARLKRVLLSLSACTHEGLVRHCQNICYSIVVFHVRSAKLYLEFLCLASNFSYLFDTVQPGRHKAPEQAERPLLRRTSPTYLLADSFLQLILCRVIINAHLLPQTC